VAVKLEMVIIFTPTGTTSIPLQQIKERGLSMSYTTSSPHQCVFVKVRGKKVGGCSGVMGPVNFEVGKGKS
jgi:hypothetical protein